MALSLPEPLCGRAQERCLLSILPIRISLHSQPITKPAWSPKNTGTVRIFTLTPPESGCRARVVGEVPAEQQGGGRGRACLRRRQSATVQSEDALIGARKDGAFCRWLSAVDADAGAAGLFSRHAPRGGAG